MAFCGPPGGGFGRPKKNELNTWIAHQQANHDQASSHYFSKKPRPGEPYATVPYVTPGGDSLLRLSGWPKVERVLQIVDEIEALGIDPADAAPDYWRHVHNRLSAGLGPRSYTATQHRAWLLRQTCPPDPQTQRTATAGSVS